MALKKIIVTLYKEESYVPIGFGTLPGHICVVDLNYTILVFEAYEFNIRLLIFEKGIRCETSACVAVRYKVSEVDKLLYSIDAHISCGHGLSQCLPYSDLNF